MSAYRDTFPNRHTCLPVIHIESRDQVLRNVGLAMNCGADGVFLINHGKMDVHDLIEMYHLARERYPDFWIGLNMLGIPNREAIGLVPENTCSLWSDNAGITDHSVGTALDFMRSARRSGWKGMHFGGVAFKHQEPVRNPADAAKRAVPYVDVVTTSGPATGSPPNPEKIRSMKAAIGDKPLAIASGISPDNVRDFLDADCFLMATGISSSFHELSARLLHSLLSKLDRTRRAPDRIAS